MDLNPCFVQYLRLYDDICCRTETMCETSLTHSPWSNYRLNWLLMSSHCHTSMLLCSLDHFTDSQLFLTFSWLSHKCRPHFHLSRSAARITPVHKDNNTAKIVLTFIPGLGLFGSFVVRWTRFCQICSTTSLIKVIKIPVCLSAITELKLYISLTLMSQRCVLSPSLMWLLRLRVTTLVRHQWRSGLGQVFRNPCLLL